MTQVRAKKGSFTDCPVCKTSVYRPNSQSNRLFCSISCRDIGKRRETYNDDNKTKRCSCCGEWKQFDSFATSKGDKASKQEIALQAYCSSCSLKKSAEWAARNKDAKRRHRRESDARNAEKLKVVRANRSNEQREARNKNHRQWRKANMDKVLMWNRLRRYKERAAGDMPHRFDIGRLLCDQDAHCTYCKELLVGEYHIDHKIPVSRGGLNEIENLQILCPTCNMKKGAMTHDEYAEKLNRSMLNMTKKTELALANDTLESLYG